MNFLLRLFFKTVHGENLKFLTTKGVPVDLIKEVRLVGKNLDEKAALKTKLTISVYEQRTNFISG